MPEPNPKDPARVRKIIRHGGILGAALTLLTIPVGIGGQQHQLFNYKPPVFNLLQDPTKVRPGPIEKRFILQPRSASMFVLREKAPRFTEPVLLSAGNSKSVQKPAETVVSESHPFQDHIQKAADTYQVDAALIRAIIRTESNYDPRAVSHRGAMGLMQLMPATARGLGIEDSFDPALNIDGGVRLLRKLLDDFDGDVKLALAAYNAGRRYVRQYGGVPPFEETRLFIQKVMRLHKKYTGETASNPTAHPAV